MNVAAAAAYAERHALHALLVQCGEDIVFERYAGGYDADKPHALYSGTKSFWGVLAVAAQHDGLLDIDEPVSATLAGWSGGAKARVRLRDLLQLTSGIGFGGLGPAVPSFDKAAAAELKDEPRTTFTYGGIPLQVFGAVLARKLPRGLSPNEYLHERILDPIGMHVGSWRTLKDGTLPLPTGAFVTAREWGKFGLLVRDGGSWENTIIVPPVALAHCFAASDANPRYGLGWWLSPLRKHADVVYASGAGGQAMYIVPSAGAVVVKFGGNASYKHDAFLTRLLGKKKRRECDLAALSVPRGVRG